MIARAAGDVLAFWRAAGPNKWFTKDDAFDAEIRARFLPTYEAAAAGKLRTGRRPPKARWRSPSCSTSFRATCSAATPAPSPPIRWRARSPSARSRAASTSDVPDAERQFFYLPFEHSETLRRPGALLRAVRARPAMPTC